MLLSILTRMVEGIPQSRRSADMDLLVEMRVLMAPDADFLDVHLDYENSSGCSLVRGG